MNVYIARDGESLGPYSEEQLREYVKAGIFRPDELACFEGRDNWRPIKDVFPPRMAKIAIPAPTQTIEPRRTEEAKLAGSKKDRSTSLGFLTAFGGVFAAGLALMLVWHFLFASRSTTASSTTVAVAPARQTAADLFTAKGHLNGEIFIATQGGTAYKLGAVEVGLYKLERIKPTIERTKGNISTLLAALDPGVEAARANKDAKDKTAQYGYDSQAHDEYIRLLEKREAVTDGENYLTSLPGADAVTETNADGKFAIELPTRGEYAIVAKAQRSVGKDTEHYYWIIKVGLDGADQKTVMLTNNNLYGHKSGDSLIELR